MPKYSWSVVGLAIVLAACNDSRRSPVGPLDPAKIVPARGVVYEHSSDGRMQPVSGLPLWVTGRTKEFAPVTTEAVTDSAGAFDVSGLARVFLQVSVRPQEAYLSPCSSRVWERNGDPVSIHVMSKQTFLASGAPFSMPPYQRLELGASVLPGLVTEQTPDGLRPVAGASVEHFYRRDEMHPTGFTLTQDDGSYVICRYGPDEAGDDEIQLIRVRKTGYRTALRQLEEWSSTRADVELVRE